MADRGITSFQGRPADVDVSTFYGNPADSHVRARVDLGTATVEHKAGSLTLRNRTMFGDYDRFYQNYVPGAVTADKSRVALTAYNNATARENLFNQTDLIYPRRHRPREAHPARRRRGGPPGHRQLQEHRVLQRHRHRSCSALRRARRSARR